MNTPTPVEGWCEGKPSQTMLGMPCSHCAVCTNCWDGEQEGPIYRSPATVTRGVVSCDFWRPRHGQTVAQTTPYACAPHVSGVTAGNGEHQKLGGC